jgi:molybdate transport repressor ModE-like protein
MADRPGLDVELRVTLDGAVAFGPAQAALLEAILLTGSINAARRHLGFGYVHAWKLVAAMNHRFSPPLVDIARGGSKGGGARVSKQGHEVLMAYCRMERALLAEGYAELHLIDDAARAGQVRLPENRART